MNRSHGATLLITVFTLAILGIAASTLYTAYPETINQGHASDIPGRSHMGQARAIHQQSDKQTVRLLAFPEITVEQNFKNSTESKQTIQRIAIGLVLLLFGAILVIRYLTSNDSHAKTPTDTVTDTPNNENVSDSKFNPGSDIPPMNDVYRAWRAMIVSLDNSWETQDTPTELAQKAIQAGFPETPVTELTALFCSVRYGEKQPTGEREQYAQHALDQVQQTDRSNDAESRRSER